MQLCLDNWNLWHFPNYFALGLPLSYSSLVVYFSGNITSDTGFVINMQFQAKVGLLGSIFIFIAGSFCIKIDNFHVESIFYTKLN